MSEKTIVVTGGTGFLGKSVTRNLNENHPQHRVVSISGSSFDLTKPKYVDGMLNCHSPDIVVHLAATCGGIAANREQPGKFMYDNLSMGMNLIERGRKYGKLEKFVMIGSACSYPQHTSIPFRESDMWSGYPENNNAPYGIAKRAIIELLLTYNQQYGFNSNTLIPANIYGPEDHTSPEKSNVIPAIIRKVGHAINHNEDHIKLWGSGNASREFLYVDDCAEFIVRSCFTDPDPRPVNIGTGKETKISDLATMICDIMGFSGSVVFQPEMPEGQLRRCLDVSRSKEVFGIGAGTDIETGLRTTIEWFNNTQGENNEN